jgi:hypothetical protein
LNPSEEEEKVLKYELLCLSPHCFRPNNVLVVLLNIPIRPYGGF